MGNHSDEENEMSNKEVDSEQTIYKCCGKPFNSVRCQRCMSRFHLSCAKKLTYVQLSKDGKYANCCGGSPAEHQMFGAKEVEPDWQMRTEVEVLRAENSLLKQLLQEMRDKNMLLKDHKVLLESKVVLLEEKVEGMSTDCQKPMQSSSSSCAAIAMAATGGGNASGGTGRNIKGDTGQISINAGKKEVKKSQGSGNMQKKNPSNNLIRAQEKVLSDIIHLESDLDGASDLGVGGQAAVGDVGYGVQRSQRRRIKKRLGTHQQSPEEDSTGFSGGDRRVWLYIYRVKRHVTPKMITDYIKNKPDFASVNVEARELPSDPNRLKCFVVTAPLSFKDRMYDGEFWPQNVGVKRFDFNKHKDFLVRGGDFL